jgi:hypothetical protein
MKTPVVFFALIFSAITAHADPFDAFVGTYRPAREPSVQMLNVPTCNRFDFAELQSFEVRADRTGFRQTHELRINVPNGYSLVRVVPTYKDPSELDPTVGTFGDSQGDAQKATTVTGHFGTDKNEILQLTIERVGDRYRLEIANELKSAKGLILAGCYYSADLEKRAAE